MASKKRNNNKRGKSRKASRILANKNSPEVNALVCNLPPMLTGFRSLVASESKGSALVLPPMLEQIISTFQAMSTDQMKVLAHLCKCDLEQMMIVHDFMLSNNDLLELGDEALCEIITVVFLSIEKSDGRWLSRSNFIHVGKSIQTGCFG